MINTMANAQTKPEKIDFFFDIMCPYAYQTSIWIREVRSKIELEINWRFFSLEEINREEGKNIHGSAHSPTDGLPQNCRMAKTH